ncbi:uncharacterized protein LOC132287061 [Cornus florida]|uniref:uncharacterized protein LOC132287061 n=1 Tax=Cornus florida TaxID=4283 RepID=UPI00289756AD|nr:uncharacterized protein LOC132287061 [Cornus florida]
MQATQTLSSSPSLSADELAETVADDFSSKLNLNNSKNEFEAGVGGGEEEDFSFVCNGGYTSPIAAEDVFQNGQIRPTFPLFNREVLLSGVSMPSKNDLPLRPPVRKIFIEANDPPTPRMSSSLASKSEEMETTATGSYCNWSRKAIEASPEICKKSNSTGFSKLWRIGESVNRSNSDGRDAFVFLNGSTKREEIMEKSKTSSEKNGSGAGGKGKVKKGGKREKASLSAHELHYVRNRAMKEEDRKRSYLPYRPELVGFFTNVNGGLSRNLHVPF